MDFLIVAIAIALISVVIARTISSVKKSHNQPAKRDIDRPRSQCTPANHTFSEEELKLMQQVADFCGKSDIYSVSQSDIQRHIIHSISEDFQKMLGWNIWDISIHETPGQLQRFERSLSEAIAVLAYDPKYKIAKIQGKTSIYLTSHSRCSCPDYRERKLPCKHMYALAVFLDGDVEQAVYDQNHPALYGLSFALAGRFSGGRNSPEGIRAKITARGGLWSDDLQKESCAIICGEGASTAKMADAKFQDLQIFSSSEAMDIFALENNNNNEQGATP